MNFIITKDEYLQAKKAWTQPGYHRNAADHIIYNALRGYDLQRGFSPITDERKLQGSADVWQSYKNAKTDASWMLRSSRQWPGETPDRATMREADDAKRFDNLGLKFGITFAPELVSTLRELLK